jgi:methyl-accepting chemotaxis protein
MMDINPIIERANDLSIRLEKAHEEIAKLREALEKIVDPMTDALNFIKHTAREALRR